MTRSGNYNAYFDNSVTQHEKFGLVCDFSQSLKIRFILLGNLQKDFLDILPSGQFPHFSKLNLMKLSHLKENERIDFLTFHDKFNDIFPYLSSQIKPEDDSFQCIWRIFNLQKKFEFIEK